MAWLLQNLPWSNGRSDMVEFQRLAAACVAAAALLVGGAASAAPRHMELAGTKFAVDGSCAKQVTISPDAALSGHVVVDASADHPEEMAQLVLEDRHDAATLHGPRNGCWQAGGFWGFSPTMVITVHVPTGMPISLDESGGVEYTIGAVGGPLALDLSGGVRLQAEHATTLAIDVSGGAEITVDRVEGALTGDLSGGSNITLHHATVSAMTLDLSGGGDFTIGDGHIGALKLDVSGGGQIQIGASVGDAHVDVSGAGQVNIAHVTGTLSKDVSGAGEVNVGQ
jgi:hypothetical protein